MAFLFLTNTVGASATAITSTVQAGSDKTRMIAGPRSQLTHGANGTTWTMQYTCASQAVTHCVITNADLFAHSQDGGNVVVNYGATPTTDSTTAAGSMTLVGPNDQDWVRTISQTSTKFGLSFSHAVASDTVVGKVFFSNSFDFSVPPQLVSATEVAEKVRPLLGHRQYATERVFELTWANVTEAKLTAFKALPIQIPFCIYDESGHLFDYKLEHVLIADPWTEARRLDGNYTLTLAVRRLTQYVR